MNAHLAAFDDYLDRRNADFHDLSHRLLFELPSNDDEAPRDETNAENVFQSDAVFWMVSAFEIQFIRRFIEPRRVVSFFILSRTHVLRGIISDLNYRINLPDLEVRQMIAGDPDLNVRELLAHDQVRIYIYQG